MRITEVLEKVYSRRQDINRFMRVNNIKEDSDLSITEMLIVVQNLSNKDKRKKAVEIIMLNFTEVSSIKLSDIRGKSYKQIAKVCHPDSPTGDVQSFQTLQEIKELFWGYDGKPRKEIKKICWEHEQKIAQGYTYDIFTGKYKNKK